MHPRIRINLRCKIKSGEREIASNSDISGMKFRIIFPISGQIFNISLFKSMNAIRFKNKKLLTFCIMKLKIS